MSADSPLSTAPSQLSSTSLHDSVPGVPGVHTFGEPEAQAAMLRKHAPTPQVSVEGEPATFVHVPAVVPVQVAVFSAWHVLLQFVVMGPAPDVGQRLAAVSHAPAPLQNAPAAEMFHMNFVLYIQSRDMLLLTSAYMSTAYAGRPPAPLRPRDPPSRAGCPLWTASETPVATQRMA